MTDENKNNPINGNYKHEKNSRRTGGEFHVNSASYPRVMPGGGAWLSNSVYIITLTVTCGKSTCRCIWSSIGITSQCKGSGLIRFKQVVTCDIHLCVISPFSIFIWIWINCCIHYRHSTIVYWNINKGLEAYLRGDWLDQVTESYVHLGDILQCRHLFCELPSGKFYFKQYIITSFIFIQGEASSQNKWLYQNSECLHSPWARSRLEK